MHDYRPIEAAPQPVKLRIEDYLLLDESGAFRDYGKTELIDGAPLAMNAEASPHVRIKMRLGRRLADACDRLGGGLKPGLRGRS